MLTLPRLLLVCTILGQVLALDEREYDPQVAPLAMETTVLKPFQLWRSFASQVRLALSRWQPKPKPKPMAEPEPLTRTTVRTRTRSSTSPEPELQFYGALNPIYQMGNF